MDVLNDLPFEIDYVFPYVDNTDDVWQRQYIEFCKAKGKAVEIDSERYFDYGLLKYLFRGIQNNLPWIRNIYLILQQESQTPKWLDTDKVKIVYHKDIIPKDLLPTYNSCTIECFLHNVPGLSEYFVYGNDDMFPIKPCKKSDFFDSNGLPKLKIKKIDYIPTERPYLYHIKRAERLCNEALGLVNDEKYTYLWNHTLSPMRKSTCELLHNKFDEKIKHACTPFRSVINYCQSLINDWQFLSGGTSKERYTLNTKYFSGCLASLEKFYDEVSNYQVVCLNDNAERSAVNFLKYEYQRIFDKMFPQKCKYEKCSLLTETFNKKDCKLDIKIYGIHKRDNWINSQKKELSLFDNDIIYDDRPNGGKAIYACEKAWKQPIPEGVTHRLVFPDDMITCDNFVEIVTKIINTHPTCIIALFPNAYRKIENDEIFKNLKSPYLKGKGFAGCGIIMPVEYIEPCFSWLHKIYRDSFLNQIDDQAMYKWIKETNKNVINTCPALVQHIGDNSVLTPNAEVRRTAWFKQKINNNEVQWDSLLIIPIDAYFSNSKKSINVYD